LELNIPRISTSKRVLPISPRSDEGLIGPLPPTPQPFQPSSAMQQDFRLATPYTSASGPSSSTFPSLSEILCYAIRPTGLVSQWKEWALKHGLLFFPSALPVPWHVQLPALRHQHNPSLEDTSPSRLLALPSRTTFCRCSSPVLPPEVFLFRFHCGLILRQLNIQTSRCRGKGQPHFMQ
jgi:hypothetical protein